MTQRDLMELFSVSQATVSMALKNNPRISLKLRQEIQKAAREMGYCPNPAGQLLRKGKSNLIGVILPSLYYSFYAEFLEELHNYIQNCGYVLLMKNCETREGFAAAMQSMKQFNVSGIMAVCALDWIKTLLDKSIPTVLLLGHDFTPDPQFRLSQVYPDMYQCGYDLADHLLKQGRKHPAFLGKIDNAELRFRGFDARIKKSGIAETPFIHCAKGTTLDGYNLIRSLLEQFPETDAVAVHNDNMAVGALRWLWEQRIDVPGRIAVTGFDNIREDAFTTPALTSIGPDCRKFAKTAFDELRKMISDPTHQSKIKIHCKLTVRESA